jgi:hypothetical protein
LRSKAAVSLSDGLEFAALPQTPKPKAVGFGQAWRILAVAKITIPCGPKPPLRYHIRQAHKPHWWGMENFCYSKNYDTLRPKAAASLSHQTSS